MPGSDDDLLGGVADTSSPRRAAPRGAIVPRVSPDDIAAAARNAGVDPDWYAAIIRQESGGQTNRPSKKGALGPAQLMPDTAASLGVNPNDPIQNLQGGARYLRQLSDRYGGDRVRATAAYNAGPEAVDKAGGVPNFPETQDYVKSVLGGIGAADDHVLGGVADAGPGGAAPAPKTADPFSKDFAVAPTAGPNANLIPLVGQDGKTIGYASGPQSETVRGLMKAGRYDPNAAAGSETHPYAYPSGTQPVRGGTWYIDHDTGRLAQYKDPDSAFATVGQLARDVGNPAMIGANAIGLPQALGMPTDPRAQAMESGFTSGALLGGKNELSAAIEAVPGLFNGQGYTPTFTNLLAASDARDAALRARFPLAHDTAAVAGAGASAVAGDAAGGLLLRGAGAALPEAADVIASNPLARFASAVTRRGAVGAGLGGAQGYLAGGPGVTEAQREDQSRQGATAGLVLNEALPAAGDAFGAVGRALTSGGTPGASEAAPRVANALVNAIQRDGQSPADVIAAARANPNAPAFHAGGPNLLALADVAANTPGPAQATLRTAIANHMADAPTQVKADIGTALGGKGDYLDTLDQTIAARRTAANEGISAIAAQPVTLNENSVQALRSPLATGAIKNAAQLALASPDAATRESGAALNRIADTVLDNPSAASMTIRNAQDISRSLLDAANSAFSSGNGAMGTALKGLGRAIRDNAADPAQGGNAAYQSWLSKYGDDSDNIDALTLGHGVFSGARGNTAAQVAKTLQGMGPNAQAFYQKGVAEALIDQARSGTGGVGTMRALLRNEDLRDKVRLAFPDQDSYDKFVQSAEQRVQEQATNGRIMAGSATYPRQAARMDLENQPLHPLDVIPHALEIGGHVVTGNAPGLVGKGLRLALKNIPREDRSVIGDPQANALLGRALTDPEAMNPLLAGPLNKAGRGVVGKVPRTNPLRLTTPLSIEGANLLLHPQAPLPQGPTALPAF